MAPALGARGPWKKVREIGKGSFGLVYLVTRSGDSNTFVMKEVKLRGLSKADMISAQNEVAVLKKLKVVLCQRSSPSAPAAHLIVHANP